jgi:RNA polymerase primary sigma factor
MEGLEGLSSSSTTSSKALPARSTPARVTRARGRSRATTTSHEAAKKRVTRAPRRVGPNRDSAGIDDLYLNEMAASSVLTAAQELEIGERISTAERSIFEALFSAPAGVRALHALAADLDEGRATIRDLLLNPDQADLDLEKTAELVHAALKGATSDDPSVRTSAAADIARARIDDEVLGALVAAVREATLGPEVDTRDAASLAALERAEIELDRAKSRLVTGNLRLVVLFARKYLGRGVALLDLVQEGNLGLIRAADKFDHRRGFRFSTYAAWWIKQSLQRALLDRTVRLPVHVADDRRRIAKLRSAFMAQHEREPNVDEIAALSSLARERIENILSLPAQPSSLDIPVGEDGDARLVDLVPSGGPSPDQTAASHALGSQMSELLARLEDRERQILRLRFGLDHAREHTLEEVGKLLHLTRERIRQIEQAALVKLRTLANARELATYLEE